MAPRRLFTSFVWLAAWAGGLVLAPGRAPAAPVYFLVADPSFSRSHFDSYILPLEDPADIAAARAILQQGPQNVPAHIVFAEIAPGGDGINRNLFPPFQFWSWHVTQFRGFGELGIELYDGWPGYVEADVAGWIANTGGMIGFWSYTVVAELPPVPEPSALVLIVLAAAGGIFCPRLGRTPQESSANPRATAAARPGALGI